MNLQYGKSSWLYFHKVDKIAFGSSYKTLKLWEIHNFIFIKFVKFFLMNKKSG